MADDINKIDISNSKTIKNMNNTNINNNISENMNNDDISFLLNMTLVNNVNKYSREEFSK